VKPIVVVGSINTDLVLRAEQLPLPGETLHAESFSIFTGGKGANQAAAIARLGGRAEMLGLVGRDSLGDGLLRSLAETGLDTSLIGRAECGSGVAVITVIPSGENAILLSAGANGQLSPDFLYSHREHIVGAGMVLTQLETPLPTLDALALLCAEHRVPLMLDPAPMQAISAETMRRVTWLTPNESEAESLFGIRPGEVSEVSLRKLADSVMRDGPRNLLLKLGARGAYVATAAGRREMVASFPVAVVDTTAAGDCFNGAFAWRLVHGDDPHEAARFAVAAAAVSVTRAGALPSLPTEAEVRTLMNSMQSSPLEVRS
jgi:ribokinase